MVGKKNAVTDIQFLLHRTATTDTSADKYDDP
jgi:hypothetical protein